ncbi:putative transposase [Escherichia coli Jurua 20/10]|nr:putative transposase [Escherichia coli Jurua 20/10]
MGHVRHKRRSLGKTRPVVCQFENVPLLWLQNAGNATS